MNRRFFFTILFIVATALIAGGAVFFAKGYRFSPEKGTFSGTGIMSITSIPDQASVYLDGHLSTATNANINSLVPKKYKVRIIKEGYIPWEKELEVKEGLVTEIKARLFPAIPSIFPLTYNGIENSILSPDGQKLVFVVPDGVDSDVASSPPKKSGIWVWTMSERPIAFARANEPHQIMVSQSGINLSQAKIRWSPDSSQIMVTLPDRTLLLEDDRLNESPRDITPILQPTLSSWEEEKSTKDLARIQSIKDLNLQKIASSSALVKWAPDETKFLICEDKENCLEQVEPQSLLLTENKVAEESEKSNTPQKKKFKIVDLKKRETFTLPESYQALWLPDSLHLVLVDENKISVIEFDGGNNHVIYAGTFDINSVYAWPDGSRLAIITFFPIPTAERPNLYGINLK